MDYILETEDKLMPHRNYMKPWQYKMIISRHVPLITHI